MQARMIRNQLLPILLLFLARTVFGQERIWTQQTKISQVIEFEKSIDPEVTFLSQNESLAKDYYPLVDKHPVENPIIAQRKPIGYLPVYAEYFYTLGDSLLRLVSYDWEKDRYGNFFDQQKIWKTEDKNFAAYDNEYLRIRAMNLQSKANSLLEKLIFCVCPGCSTSSSSKIIVNCKRKLLDEQLFIRRQIILLIEKNHGLFVVNGLNTPV